MPQPLSAIVVDAIAHESCVASSVATTAARPQNSIALFETLCNKYGRGSALHRKMGRLGIL